MRIINKKMIRERFSKLIGLHKCHICNKNAAAWIDGYREKDNIVYCESCARDNFNICNYCNKIVDKLYKVKDTYVCKNCFDNKTSLCEECGAREYTSSLIGFRRKRVCEVCYSSLNRYFNEIDIGETKKASKTFVKNKSKGYCGVEIECLNGNLNKNCFIQKELIKYGFSQGSDASLNGGGAEFASVPMNGDLLFDSIESFGKSLVEKKYRVDKSCGLHIHLEVEHELEFLKKLYLFYLRFESLFFDMLPKSRRSSSYCKRFERYYVDSPEDIIGIKTLDAFKEMLYETKNYNSKIRSHGHHKRYCWANLHSIFYRGTLEIRSHSGTISNLKIINWIMIHQRVLEFLQGKSVGEIWEMKVSRKNFLDIFSSPLQNYIKKRWKTFILLEEKDLNIRIPCYKRRGGLS